eukprot:Phypoly_transcript_25864.p1 GENE.Phypoly_transcript_25864~~Phypoly_transcript_25864.p1  ORF type:complete len:139 (+),score=18.91 Phypoly_transcript_25864:55-471(+)
MVIFGIGNDLIAISRIQQIYRRFGNRFLNRFLNSHEINEFRNRYKITNAQNGNIPNRAYEHLASLWAAKESIYKAFGGTDRNRLNFTNIKLIYTPKGKPEVEFEGTTKELATELGITRVHLAITHDEQYVVANAILEQ